MLCVKITLVTFVTILRIWGLGGGGETDEIEHKSHSELIKTIFDRHCCCLCIAVLLNDITMDVLCCKLIAHVLWRNCSGYNIAEVSQMIDSMFCMIWTKTTPVLSNPPTISKLLMSNLLRFAAPRPFLSNHISNIGLAPRGKITLVWNKFFDIPVFRNLHLEAILGANLLRAVCDQPVAYKWKDSALMVMVYMRSVCEIVCHVTLLLWYIMVLLVGFWGLLIMCGQGIYKIWMRANKKK